MVVVGTQGFGVQSSKSRNCPCRTEHWQRLVNTHWSAMQHADVGVVVLAYAHAVAEVQSPGPTLMPEVAQSAVVMTWHMSKGPQVTVRTQHWVASTLVVVVVVALAIVVVVDVVIVVAQLGPLPGDGQASQQLVHAPGVPPLAAQDAASRVVPHFVFPFFVRQQVTEPGVFPHVEWPAHRFACPRQLRFTSVASICRAAQLT